MNTKISNAHIVEKFEYEARALATSTEDSCVSAWRPKVQFGFLFLVVNVERDDRRTLFDFIGKVIPIFWPQHS